MKKLFLAVGFTLLSAICAAQESAYSNPIDNKNYVAPGGWKKYEPEGGVRPQTGKIKLGGVRLLQDQTEMGQRTNVKEMSSFIDAAHQAASEVFAPYKTRATLLVQFECTPSRCKPTIASQGNPPQELLQAYYDTLTRLPPLKVSDEVRFQITLNVEP